MMATARTHRSPPARAAAGRGLNSCRFAVVVAGLVLASGTALADRIKNPTAVFAGLDKITGRIISFEVAIDETVQFGSLQVTPRACFTRPPTEAPQTDTFVEIDEVAASNEYKRIFGGWMFAASPGLHALEHPIYDVWLTNCKGGDPERDLIKTPSETVVNGEEPQPEGVQPPPPKPGTVPRPRRQAGTGDATTLPGPPVPGGGAPSIQSQPLPPPTRRQPSQRFFPTNVAPPAPPANDGLPWPDTQ